MDFDTHNDNFTREDEVTVDAVNSDGRPTITFDRDQANPDRAPELKPERPRRSRRRAILWWTIIIMAVVLVAAFWIRYFNPYSVGAQERGYIVAIECRGFIFKTWEGQMAVSSDLNNQSSPYMRNFDFSVESEKVANELLRYKNERREVTVTYKRFLGTIPWRGEHKFIVTSVTPTDTVAARPLTDPRLDETDPPAEEMLTSPQTPEGSIPDNLDPSY